MGERLTASDVKKIEEEIEYRRLVERKRILNDVKEARAQGDLSENFEYYAAKKEKNRNDGRIRYLEKMLKYATQLSGLNQYTASSIKPSGFHTQSRRFKCAFSCAMT